MRFRWVGYALLTASLGACSGRSEGDAPQGDQAGNGSGGAAASGGSESAGRASTAGRGGAASGGQPAGDAGETTVGGKTGGDGGDAASGGTASAGSASAGSASAGSASGGAASGTPWCPEWDVCKFGVDERLEPGEACPQGRDCYADEWCGKSIQCVKYVDDGTCTQMPVCGSAQLTVPLCSGLGICETRSACGKSVVCETLQKGCSPGLQKDRVFAALPEECGAISIHCPEGSNPFADTCGCGCEQPADCPDSVNCQPTSGDPRSDLCDNSKQCPFTARPQ